MQRDLLFLNEAIQAAEKIVRLSEGATAESLQADERTLDAVLWNFTVLGEACSQFTQKELFSFHPAGPCPRRIVLTLPASAEEGIRSLGRTLFAGWGPLMPLVVGADSVVDVGATMAMTT